MIDLDKLRGIPQAEGEPVFAEPWEAQAFAMAVSLNKQGMFTWNEWADTLSAKLAVEDANKSGADYYMHWLAALEEIVAVKCNVTPQDQEDRKDQWLRAAAATPHGQTILLKNDPQAC